MSDDFLDRLREEPRPEFAEGLERRLRHIDAAETEGRSRVTRSLRPALAAALMLTMIIAGFTWPPVSALARGFLDLFRVQRFAAVPVDTGRLARLEQRGVDLRALVGDQVQVIEPAVEPEAVESVEVASALAGVLVRTPSAPPRGSALAEVAVARPGAFRVRLETARLRSLADALGVEGAEIPAAWEGAALEVHAPPVVRMRYHRDDDDFVLMQSQTPEVALPEGVDLAELGALGLRMAGMSAEEARLFARRIDWRSTLLVPVPAEGSHFREVEVGERRGLLVSGRGRERTATDGTSRRGRWHAVLLWADEDRVYAAFGPGHGMEVLEMAQSLE